jgi:NTE family protein
MFATPKHVSAMGAATPIAPTSPGIGLQQAYIALHNTAIGMARDGVAMATATDNRKSLNLALQGGGAHGAFTWGVLDRILEDERIAIEGISGTSAGAMNAVVLAGGFGKDGSEGARAALEAFWQAVSEAASKSPIQRSPLDMVLGRWTLDTAPGLLVMDILSRVMSPYTFNPLNINPLKDLIEEQVDFEAVRGCGSIKLFVAATNVHSGKVRVFKSPEIDADVVMASACLPYIYQAVEIGGVPYWDGGYMGNPVIFPLIYNTDSRDVLLVQINPIERQSTPRSPREIYNRINEITFNSSLLRELRAIEFAARLIEQEKLDEKRYKKVLLHRIGGGDELEHLSASSKLNTEWAFLTHLRDIGRKTAGNWLETHFDAIGRSGTVDLRAMVA